MASWSHRVWRPRCRTWFALAFASSGCVTQITVNKDAADTAETPTADTPDPDLPSDTPVDSPTDTPTPPAPVTPAATQGCAAAVNASDGMYGTVGCLAPLQVTPETRPATDGGFTLEPGALRQVTP